MNEFLTFTKMDYTQNLMQNEGNLHQPKSRESLARSLGLEGLNPKESLL